MIFDKNSEEAVWEKGNFQQAGILQLFETTNYWSQFLIVFRTGLISFEKRDKSGSAKDLRVH